MDNFNSIKAGEAYVSISAKSDSLKYSLNKAAKDLKVFATDVSKVEKKPLTLSEIKAEAFGKSLKKASTLFSRFSDGIRNQALVLAASLAGIQSVRVFVGYDDQIRAVKAATSSTAEEFDMLNEKAQLLGRTTSFTAAEVAGGMYELGLAGFRANSIDASISSVMNLARATRTDLPLATEIAMQALRAFGLNANEMTHVVDVLTASANASAISLEDIGQTFKYIGPLPSIAGLTLEHVAKMMAMMGNFGIKGSLAGTAIKNILLQISDPEIQKRYEALGIQVLDLEGSLRLLPEVLEEYGVASQNLPSGTKLQYLNKLFNDRAMAGGAILLKGIPSDISAAIDNAEGMAAYVSKEMDAGVGGSFRRFRGAIESVGITSMSAFQKEIREITLSISKLLTSFSNFISKNKEVILTVGKTVTKLTALSVAAYAVAKVFSTLNSTWNFYKKVRENAADVALYTGLLNKLKYVINAIRVHPLLAVAVALATVGAALAAYFGIFHKHTAKIKNDMEAISSYNKRQGADSLQMFARLQELSQSPKLNIDELEEAVYLTDRLGGKYKGVIINVDMLNKKITIAADAQERLNAAIMEGRKIDLKAEIEEGKLNLNELDKEIDYIKKSRGLTFLDKVSNALATSGLSGPGVGGTIHSSEEYEKILKKYGDNYDKDLKEAIKKRELLLEEIEAKEGVLKSISLTGKDVTENYLAAAPLGANEASDEVAGSGKRSIENDIADYLRETSELFKSEEENAISDINRTFEKLRTDILNSTEPIFDLNVKLAELEDARNKRIAYTQSSFSDKRNQESQKRYEEALKNVSEFEKKYLEESRTDLQKKVDVIENETKAYKDQLSFLKDIAQQKSIEAERSYDQHLDSMLDLPTNLAAVEKLQEAEAERVRLENNLLAARQEELKYEQLLATAEKNRLDRLAKIEKEARKEYGLDKSEIDTITLEAELLALNNEYNNGRPGVTRRRHLTREIGDKQIELLAAKSRQEQSRYQGAYADLFRVNSDLLVALDELKKAEETKDAQTIVDALTRVGLLKEEKKDVIDVIKEFEKTGESPEKLLDNSIQDSLRITKNLAGSGGTFNVFEANARANKNATLEDYAKRQIDLLRDIRDNTESAEATFA